MKDITKTIKILSSLADENRFIIIKELLLRDYCVGGLARKLNITEAAVSQHLKILKEVGLITGEKRGYYRHYRVNKEILKYVAKEIEVISEIKRESSVLCPPSNKNDCLLCRKGS
ncbi:MAG: metalloregulator ArsR/SmtB family transcription factor [Sphaerochaetaceae bacterium]